MPDRDSTKFWPDRHYLLEFWMSKDWAENPFDILYKMFDAASRSVF